MPELSEPLEGALLRVVEQVLLSPATTASERWLHERIRGAARAAADLLLELGEPFETEPKLGTVLELVGALHVYARIVDDAVDEGLLASRTTLLRAQPMLWRIAGGVALLAPELSGASESLIRETVDAAGRDSAEATDIAELGRRNNHLLLAPLLLLGDTSRFADVKEALSTVLGLCQALAEFDQGHVSPVAAARWERWVATSSVEDAACLLAGHGWRRFAQTGIHAAQELTNRLGYARGAYATRKPT